MAEPRAAHQVPASLREKSIAIASGKGGVGKSVAALNFALQFARRGANVGLLDLDPLSNIAILLDVDNDTLAASASGERVSRRADGNAQRDTGTDGGELGAYCYEVFSRLHLVFPSPNRPEESIAVRRELFERFAGELDRRYDVLLFDMPAGISKDENLAFLPDVANLVVVVQTEPTSQVSAGGYLKAALEIAPDINVYFLLNRVSGTHRATPASVVSTYNTYVPEELQIDSGAIEAIRTLGTVPEDPALDLLQDSFSVDVSVLYRLQSLVAVVREELAPQLPESLGFGQKTRRLLSSYLARHPYIDRIDSYVEAIEDFLADLLYTEGLMSREQMARMSEDQSPVLDETQRGILSRYLEDLSRSTFWSSIVSLSREVDTTLDELRNRGRMFHVSVETRTLERVEQLLTKFLRNLAMMREDRRRRAGDAGGILLFYLAMVKLIKADSIQKLFREFVPMRRDGNERIRDRRTQIRRLVERDSAYHDQFLSIVRTVYPVLTRQLSRLMDRYALHDLLLRGPDGEANREAYLKLLTQFIHDTVNSGLGVAVGIRYTPASEALKEGADALLKEVSGQRRSVST